MTVLLQEFVLNSELDPNGTYIGYDESGPFGSLDPAPSFLDGQNVKALFTNFDNQTLFLIMDAPEAVARDYFNTMKLQGPGVNQGDIYVRSDGSGSNYAAFPNATLFYWTVPVSLLAGQQYTVGFYSDEGIRENPDIPATSDLDPFFQAGELAQVALYNGVQSIPVILTEYYSDIIGGEYGGAGTKPLMIAKLSDIPLVTEGDFIGVADKVYTVREVKPDNTGIVRLTVELQPYATPLPS